MVKNTGFRGLMKEEDDIELDLGLSVGGSYSRQNDAGLRSEKSIGPGSSIRSTISCSFDDHQMMMMTKKEIHALRRQEAKKKREEKQLLKRGFCRSSLFNGGQIDEEDRECKKIKKEEIINGSDSNRKIGSCYAAPCNPSPENGFMYPCANVMPCWFSGGAEEKQMVQVLPVVGYGFVPLDLDHSSGNGYGSEENNIKSGSNNCTSSTGSDHRSSCNEGAISHSSPPVPQQPQMNGPIASNGNNDSKSHSEHTAISNISESASVNEATTTTTNTTSNPTRAENKPPLKPHVVSQEQTTQPPLPYMPCVSTTGNGPNGKTVNGFLYRYTKTEVSIICVCHGSSFSPAEFVQHAGGTDVLHPLRHITVVPSAAF